MLGVQDGMYYQNCSFVIPDVPELKQEILQDLQAARYAGHTGAERDLHYINMIYWWPAVAAEIAKHVQGSVTCQADKSLQSHPGGKLMPLPVSKEASHHITADCIVGLPQTKKGHTAILWWWWTDSLRWCALLLAHTSHVTCLSLDCRFAYCNAMQCNAMQRFCKV